MKLYYAPGACSIGIHVLLEEIGKPYEAEVVNLREGAQYKTDFTTVNPKSKVPTLARDDGTVLTEFPAIAYWLARNNPFANLLPDNIDLQTKVLELMDYAVATVHMQGFGRQFRAANFTPNPADEDAVKAKGKEIAAKGFELLDKALEGKEYAVGKFSIADAAIF
jgi:glutathione S-transferase